jgi:hypothetical protein
MRFFRTLHVDFNDQTKDGLIETTFDPYIEYTLVDGDGNTVRAELVAIDTRSKLAALRPDWSTWQPHVPETPEQARESAETNAAVRAWMVELDRGEGQ